VHTGPGPGSRDHYTRLAATYDDNWSYSPGYISWMTGCILARAHLQPGDSIADIGCGTGLYARGLAAAAGTVICADPSAAMLAQLPDSPEYIRVRACAEDIAARRVRLPASPLNAIVIKEAIHHIGPGDRPWVLGGLAGLLARSGRIVIVMLPSHIGYPLFTAARRLFEERQPSPGDIAGILTRAGLTTDVTYEQYPLSFPRDRYLQMIRNRYMSLLSAFTDQEIEDGITEIAAAHPGNDIEFTDQFAFITGQAR
jgi:ubiquinone/menaquinone biosynthesis C-methylase UbiE